MWKAIGLIGRDKLLQKDITPGIIQKHPFFLNGQKGVGKTALLQWAYEKTKERKAYFSATETVKEMLITIAAQWHLQIVNQGKAVSPEKAQLSVLEKAVAQVDSGILFIDDINKATPTKIRRFRQWKERFTLYVAGSPPYREDLKQILWGLKEIEVKPIPKEERERLARLMCTHHGAALMIEDVARESRGIPGRMMAMALGNQIDRSSERVKEEEIDISWTILFVIVAIAATRYIGMGLGRIDLYILGGIFMGFGLLLRFFLYKFQKK